MPVGTGVETLQNIPSTQYITDPASFFQLTKRQVKSPESKTLPAAGAFTSVLLPKFGVLAKAMVTFQGQLVVGGATGTVTPTNEWPYNLARNVQVNLGGSHEAINVSGCDLHALRFVRYPAYDERVDAFPGLPAGTSRADHVLGSDAWAALANNTYDLHLTWEVPLAVDDVSLIGALFMQSESANATLRIQRALDSDLFAITAGDRTVAITGDLSYQVTVFEVPKTPDGRLVTPDLSRLHQINATDIPFTNVGDVRAPLIRSDGNLARLLISAEAADNTPLSARPGTPAARRINEVSLEYGLRQRPFTWTPAAALLATNNQHYGSVVPYDRLVLDQVKENPPRDAILMAGLTELAAVINVNSSVAPTAAMVRVVQETLG